MDKALVRSIGPYVVGLAIAAGLYIYSGTFEYTLGAIHSAPRRGRALPFC